MSWLEELRQLGELVAVQAELLQRVRTDLPEAIRDTYSRLESADASILRDLDRSTQRIQLLELENRELRERLVRVETFLSVASRSPSAACDFSSADPALPAGHEE